TQGCQLTLPAGATFALDLADTAGSAVMRAQLTEIGFAESDGAEATLRLTTVGSGTSAELTTGPADTLAAEGYRLEVDADGAAIVGTDAAGVFYGVQTLRQLARIEPGSLPCVVV